MGVLLTDMLNREEGKTLEFKQDLSSPRNVMKTLVAFANAAGGRLVVGVTDDRKVVGVADPLDEEERLTNLIADAIAPRLVPNVELASEADTTLLVVEVFPSNSRPHYLTRPGPEEGVYVRIGSSNRRADADWIAEARRSFAGHVFDERPMPELDRDALDMEAIERWFDAELDDEALLTLKLLVREQGRLVPTQGAVLLFGQHRTRHFPDAWIQCGRFRGMDKTDIFDQSEIQTNLPDSVRAIEQFLKKHATKSARFGDMQREDVWSIPITMLREAIINALVHSDYAQRGTPTRIAFFDDRIDVESPGMLLPGMTIDDMKSGVSRIRNPVIARVFRELNLIEQWGSGVKRIFAEAESLNLPAPAITEMATGLRLTIYLNEAHGASETLSKSGSHSGLEKIYGLESRPESGLESRLESQLAARVLRVLATETTNKSTLAKRLGHKSVSSGLNRQIRDLLEQELIAMTLPDKPQSRLQQYQLTEKGQSLLTQYTTDKPSDDE